MIQVKSVGGCGSYHARQGGAVMGRIQLMRSIVTCTLASCAATQSLAQVAVAIVEDIQGKVANLEVMDYVTPGTAFRLEPNSSIVLDYMKSCRQETITGGTVTIEVDRSSVQGGVVQRVETDCVLPYKELSDQQIRESGATVIRSLRLDEEPKTDKPVSITIHGLSPIIDIGKEGMLVIKRVDMPGMPEEIVVEYQSLVRGRFYDFAQERRELSPGGTYAVKFGNRVQFVHVYPAAKPGKTPVSGRLVQFPQQAPG
jgi:hypothetical protein